jgi:hypothetical protein
MGKHTTELSMDELGIQFKVWHLTYTLFRGDDSRLTMSSQLIVASGVTWLFGTVAVKLAVLWMYMRIFTTKSFKLWVWILIAITCGYCVSFFATFFTNCYPISQQWDPVPGGWCRDMSLEQLTSVSLNIVVDLAIVVLPMPWLWGLQMATRNKIFVSIMFSIGLV